MTVRYLAHNLGNGIRHKLNLSDKHVFFSACDPKKVRVGGRGLQPNGLRIGDIGDIQIYTDGCGVGEPEVLVIVPGMSLK